MVQKIVINRCYGGFGISQQARDAIKSNGIEYMSSYEWLRTSEHLIKLIEEKGSKWCSDRLAYLQIVEIPDDVQWVIEEYDGIEWVAEQHRTWGR